MQTLTTPEQSALLNLVTQGVGTASRRAYTTAVSDYFGWWARHDRPALSKASVLAWRLDMEQRGLAASTICQRMSAMRKLAMEAGDAGIIPQVDAAAIMRAKSPKVKGNRLGHWLTAEQAQLLLNAPDPATPIGLRDRAILGLLLGAGMRRAEIKALRVEDVRQLEGRWVIGDFEGKGRRIRTVPIAQWVFDRLAAHWAEAGITTGAAIRAYDKIQTLTPRPLGPQGIYHLVCNYAESIGLGKVAPHDLRRTFAQLSYRNGADAKQVQHSLGHGSVVTTERYLGAHQNLRDAPSDHLPLG